MRAGTLQLHDGKVARAAGACVRGPLVAESCVTGRSLNFPPGARHCSDLAVRLLSKAKRLFSPPARRSYHQSTSLYDPLPAPQTKDFARIFANLPACRQKWSRADLKGLQPSLV